MQAINRIFFRGLITLLPVALTIYIVYSALLILENVLGSVLKKILPESFYVPGMGFALTIVLIFIFGLMLNNFITSRILLALESKLTEVPFIKAVYSPLKDLMNLFSKKEEQKNNSVVLVKLGDSGAQALGIVTREFFSDIHLESLAQNKVAVYFPLSYGIGGFTILVPKELITRIDLPMEKAMSLAITAWVKDERKSN